jgi:hypothetical protein
MMLDWAALASGFHRNHGEVVRHGFDCGVSPLDSGFRLGNEFSAAWFRRAVSERPNRGFRPSSNKNLL